MTKYKYTEEDLDNFIKVALRLVREAGVIIQKSISTSKAITSKKPSSSNGPGNASQVLTETDKFVENLIVNGLKKEFSDHKFIGEEDVYEKGEIIEFTNYPTWIIDPIDGTINFVHRNPLVCTSVGLAINKRVVLGIVNCPIINQLYTSIKGRGAFLNEKPIRTSGVTKLKDAMIIMEMPAGSNDAKQKVAISNVTSLLSKVHALRSPGPAAMDMCWVGSESADAYFHYGIHCWDMAAGALIITEAGGCILSPNGDEFDLMGCQCLVASTEKLARELVKTLTHYKVDQEFQEKCPL